MKRKFASQTAPKPYWKNAILLAITALALCASPVIALAAECPGGRAYWNVQLVIGDWFEESNWIGGVPTSSTGASINNGGTARIGRTGAESCDLTLGGAATESGTLVVDHGALVISFDAAVGGYGNGVLTITNGGTVTASLAGIAEVAGSNGAATVDTNSQWTLGGELDVGAGGTGLLTVTNGGTVSAGSIHLYKSGTLTGNGTVSTTGGTTIEGTIEPSGGRLTVSSGDLTFFGTSPLMLSNVTPTSQDNVYVSAGAATLTGKLKVTMTGTFTPGTTYTLLHADGTLGNTRFQSYSINYPTCQCFSPVIQYDTNNVKLYLDFVPCCQ